jgi:hypothetical protein
MRLSARNPKKHMRHTLKIETINTEHSEHVRANRAPVAAHHEAALARQAMDTQALLVKGISSCVANDLQSSTFLGFLNARRNALLSHFGGDIAPK